jgi:hypothetical protein
MGRTGDVAERRATRPNGEWGYRPLGDKFPRHKILNLRFCGKLSECPGVTLNTTSFRNFHGCARTLRQILLGNKNIPNRSIVLAAICWAPSAQRRCNPTRRCAYSVKRDLLQGQKRPHRDPRRWCNPTGRCAYRPSVTS